MVKILTGKVISLKMNKVAVVEVERSRLHPKYHKPVRKTKRYKVQNTQEVKVGDMVAITQTRPISSQTNWKIVPLKKKDQHGTA